MNTPQRCFTIMLKVSGDTWKDALEALNQAVELLEERGPDCRSVMSGSRSHHNITVYHDANMTPEKYIKAVREYLEEMSNP